MAVPVVVISGLPGSGKTTVGRALSEAVNLPLLSIDAVKEAIADHLDGADRFAMRAAAREVVARLVETCPRGCLVDIWVNPLRDNDDVRALLRGIDAEIEVFEVVCRVPVETAVARYAGRDRHRAHLPADENSFERIREAAPHIESIGLGPTYDLDTSQSLDIDDLLDWLRRHEVTATC